MQACKNSMYILCVFNDAYVGCVKFKACYLGCISIIGKKLAEGVLFLFLFLFFVFVVVVVVFFLYLVNAFMRMKFIVLKCKCLPPKSNISVYFTVNSLCILLWDCAISVS